MGCGRSRSEKLSSALWQAVQEQDVERIKILLARRADPNERFRPAASAVRSARLCFLLGVTRQYRSHPLFDPQAVRWLVRQVLPWPAHSRVLHQAVRQGAHRATQLLLGAHADPNARDKKGNTPLIWAVRTQDQVAIRALASYGADPGLRCFRRQTPLLWAMRAAGPELTRQVLTVRANANEMSTHACPRVLYAAYKGRVELLRVLSDFRAGLYAPNRHGDTALMLAAFQGHLSCVRFLLSGAAPRLVNLVTVQRQSALFFAACQGHETVVRLLLRARADPFVVDRAGHTALCLARAAGYGRVVRLLRRSLESERGSFGGRTPGASPWKKTQAWQKS